MELTVELSLVSGSPFPSFFPRLFPSLSIALHRSPSHFVTLVDFPPAEHQTLCLLLGFVNIWVLTLYAHTQGACFGGPEQANVSSTSVSNTSNATAAIAAVIPSTGYVIDGCIIDTICICFNVFWWIDCAARIYAHKWTHFWTVNDDFYQQLKNRFDFYMAFLSVALITVGLSVDLTKTVPGDPGMLRLAYCVPCFRLLSCTALTREILFSVLAIIPQYTDILILLVMIMYVLLVGLRLVADTEVWSLYVVWRHEKHRRCCTYAVRVRVPTLIHLTQSSHFSLSIPQVRVQCDRVHHLQRAVPVPI